MRSWSAFGAQIDHEHAQTHQTHNGLDLGEATTFPPIVFSIISHRGYTQMSFFSGFLNWES
jgi:hypothetical protein